MAFYRVCPSCGANLDPGEKCDCEKVRKEKREKLEKIIRTNPYTGQLSFNFEGRKRT